MVSLILPLGASAQIRLGAEFQVNTYTGDHQSVPAAVGTTGGGFVVTWSSYQDGALSGIFARRFSSGGAALASEFQVNTFTTGAQQDPVIAAGGNFVVVWQSNLQDGSSYGVFARRFSSAGVALAVELEINTYTTNDQRRPSVAASASGDFVVTWRSLLQDGSDQGIFARRFSSTGVPVAGEFQVNTYTLDRQTQPSVAASASGGFVVVWQSFFQDGEDYGIFARRFTSAGAPLAGEFQVNTYTTYFQYAPSIAADSDGNFVIAWLSYGQDGDGHGVFARRFSSTGAAVASEFQVNEHTPNYQGYPSVAAAANGTFVVAWQSDSQDNSNYAVFARHVTISGGPLASEFQVNTYTNDEQEAPAVAALGSGRFVVAWESFFQDGQGRGVFAQRFLATSALDIDGDGSAEPLTDGLLLLRYLFGFSGATLTTGAVDLAGCTRCGAASIEAYIAELEMARPLAQEIRLGSEFQVNRYTAGHQTYPWVAAAAAGDFLVTWDSNGQDGQYSGVFARRFSSAGAPQASEFQVNTYTPGGQLYPTVTASFLGSFVVAWTSLAQDGSGGGVFARRLSGAGTLVASEFQVNAYTAGFQSYPTAAVALDSELVVAWRSEGQDGSANGIFARRFASAGASLASEFQVNTYTPGSQGSFPSLASETDGDFVVAWVSYDQDGSSAGIFARRFSDAGEPLTSELQVNSYTTGQQSGPSIAADVADGEFVVAWQSLEDGSGRGVFARRFSGEGAPLTAEFQVNTYTQNNQQNLSLAADGDGDLVVAWMSDGQDGSSSGVFARRFSSTGNPLAGEFQVNTYTTGDQDYPSVALDADGHFVIAWQDSARDGSLSGVFAQRFLAALITVDIDGNGETAPLTDGLLVLRYLFGFRGAALITGAVGAGCTRCGAPAIEAYLGEITG